MDTIAGRTDDLRDNPTPSDPRRGKAREQIANALPQARGVHRPPGYWLSEIPEMKQRRVRITRTPPSEAVQKLVELVIAGGDAAAIAVFSPRKKHPKGDSYLGDQRVSNHVATPRPFVL